MFKRNHCKGGTKDKNNKEKLKRKERRQKWQDGFKGK